MAVLPTGIGPVTGGYQIERSLRFNSADSAYLNRTPASTTNRRTFTFSTWLKLGFTDTAERTIFASRDDNTAAGNFLIIAVWQNQLRIVEYASGYRINLIPTQVMRDVSAWYHLVVAIDTTQATSTDRVKVYLNGSQITVFGTATYPSQNTDLYMNVASQPLSVGSRPQGSGQVLYFNGYLTEVNLIDGQALTPSSFGETDSATGVWKPKAYTGTYGTNGFYLPFKTASQWSGYFDGTGDKLTSSTNAIAATGEFSVEAWVYQTARTVTSDQHIFSQYTSGATSGRWYLRFNGTTVAFTTGLGTSVSCATTVNTGTWYHVCVTRDSSNRVRVFLNGVLDGTAVISGSLDTAASVIGATQTANYWQGYISNVRAVSGQIPTAYQTASTTVGATIFTPSTSQLTAVSGTSLLTCQSSTFIDNSGLGRTITTAGDVITQQFSPFTLDVTDDHSGQGNHWIPNNLDLRTTGVGGDILVDSPTAYGTDTGIGGEVRGNYCTFNPLNANSAITLSNGNLTITQSNNRFCGTTISVASGKWYFEYLPANTGTGNSGIGVIRASDNVFGSDAFSAAGSYAGVGYLSSGNKNVSGTITSYGATYVSGDVIGVAIDLDSGTQTITFYKNNTSQGSINIPTASQTWMVVCDGATSVSANINFGQRAFAYTAPSGFKALCTQNLPTPTIGATSTTQAGKYFNPILYTGDGTAPKSFTGVGFQPDLVWIKSRSNAYWHHLTDAVRGANKSLYSNVTDAEATSNAVSAFGSDGFTINNTDVNVSSATYVAWNWKANGAGSTNTAGTITSTVSANTTSGFSIVTYTGNGATGGTVGHGLGVKPGFIIVKKRSATGGWVCWHQSLTGGNEQDRYIYLDLTSASGVTTNYWGSGITSSTFGVWTTGGDNNTSGATIVAYCFAPVAGYSAFGSYTGNGSADGPFVYLGFRPAYVMIKYSSSTADWIVLDKSRPGYNVIGGNLYPNGSYAEDTQTKLDFTSNGFKIRADSSNANVNVSSGTYIYAAFAEHPFKYSLAR